MNVTKIITKSANLIFQNNISQSSWVPLYCSMNVDIRIFNNCDDFINVYANQKLVGFTVH
jgi:hypothetical protein